MAFKKFPPLPAAALQTDATIIRNGVDDNNMPAEIERHSVKCRVQYKRYQDQTPEGTNVRFHIDMYVRPLPFIVSKDDSVEIFSNGGKTTGIVEDVFHYDNLDGSRHHTKIVVSEVREVGV
ncbi:hypothetical protein C1I08_14995 [Listeria monocytogenes]|nr:hypothetical protein [Listeria monocytogenes]EDO0419928.1 hypothetical protein [Listeria monocytogenes]PMQ84308.1 hypothetical protein C1I08_14995 [Listeria monocytogenes]HAO6415392.1 hypothetical protein [Listeria monocytogenes]